MPDRYAILFEVDAPALHTFGETGSRIIISKHGREGGGNVAWLAWAPSGSDRVTWEETYGLFAAEAALRDGSVLRIAYTLEPVVERSIYPFSVSGFGAPECVRKCLCQFKDNDQGLPPEKLERRPLVLALRVYECGVRAGCASSCSEDAGSD